MSESLGDLVVRVGADTEQFKRGMAKAKAQLGQLKQEARSGAIQIAKFSAGAAAAGAALAAGLVANSIAGAKEISNLSRVAGTSAADFQKMAIGAKTVGIEQEKLSDILKDVNDRVGDFVQTGGGPMADFFEKVAPKVGVTAEQFQKLSGPQALQLYVDSLEKANLSQQDMTFYMEAMASDATALLPLLRNGGEEMGKMADQADKLGIVLSDVQVDSMKEAAAQFSQVQNIVGGFIDQFSAELSPVIAEVGRRFVGLAEDAGGVAGPAKDASDFVIEAAGFMADAIEGVRRTFEVAGKGVALFGLGVQEMALTAAEFILNRPVQAVNELIEMFNRLPGIDIAPVSLSQWGQDAEDALQITRLAIKEGLADIESVLAEPLPSHTFEKLVADAKESSATSAAANVAKNAAIIQNNQETDDLLTQMMLDGEQIRYQIMADAAQKQLMLDEQTAASRQAALGDSLANLSTLMNSESKKAFRIGKIAAIANTIISTIESAQSSYNFGAKWGGPVLGAAFAATAVAAGTVRLQAIRNTQFGGSGSAAAANSSNTQAINHQSTPVSGQAAGASQTMYVQGINKNDLYTGDQLISMINAAQENGARLQVL